MSKVSSQQLEARRQYLDDLDTFLNKCQADVVCMLDALEWTPDNFIQVKRLGVCPYNDGHRMPREGLEKHTRMCKYLSQGCSRQDAERLLDDSSFFYEDASAVFTVKLDKELVNSVLWNHHMKQNSVYYGHSEMPLTASQEEGMLGREDRLGLAEYVVQRARAANKLRDLGPDQLQAADNMADMGNKDERQLTHVEEMAALRDFRRRRQTYRAKNVHITKKSHTEIMREVINNQMEMYAQSLSDPAAGTHHSEKAIDTDKGGNSSVTAVEDSYRRSEQGTDREAVEDKDGAARYKDGDDDMLRVDDGRDKRMDDRHKERDESRYRSSGMKRSRSERSRSRTRRSRSRSKLSRSRSKQSRSRSSRSHSRDRHRKKHKKHKKHKHKHRHRDDSDQSDTDMDGVTTPVQTPVQDNPGSTQHRQ